jgi:hypothetical protein
MSEYVCPRCNYKSDTLGNFKKHFQRQNVCPPTNSDISINEIMKEFTRNEEDGYVFKCDYCQKAFKTTRCCYQHKQRCKLNTKEQEPSSTVDIKEIRNEIESLKLQLTQHNKTINKSENVNKLKLEVLYYKNRKNEKFYQTLLEEILSSTHKRLSCGETDITTNECHAEIKEWECWKEALGQLIAYNTVDPKEKLCVYLFGKYAQNRKDTAIEVFKKNGIDVYEFQESNDGYICILDIATQAICYQYKP